MASTANSIKSQVLKLSISTNLVTPSWKEAVCTIDNGLHGTRDVDTEDTRCGTIKSGGSPNYTVDGTIAVNTTPGASETSHNALMGLFDTGAEFLWKIEDPATPANYYRSGQGFFSSYNEIAAGKSTVKADFTIENTIAIDLTP